MKILIIEDDPSLQEIIKKSLEKERYVVETADNYQAALLKLDDYDYDCILLDIMLPGGVLGQEYGVGGKRLGQAQLLVAYDADGDGVVSSVDTGRLAQVAALADEMALAIEHGGSRQRRPANRVNHYVPAY